MKSQAKATPGRHDHPSMNNRVVHSAESPHASVGLLKGNGARSGQQRFPAEV